MPKKGIPSEIYEQIEKIVSQFNKKDMPDSDFFYTTRYKGNKRQKLIFMGKAD